MKTVKVPVLKGAKVKDVRQATKEEITTMGLDDTMGRHDRLYLVELDNGVGLCALRDPEGNGPGHMVGMYKAVTFDVTEEAL